MGRIAGASARLSLAVVVLVFGIVQLVSAADPGTGAPAPVMTPEIQAKIDALARKAALPEMREASSARLKLMRDVSSLAALHGADSVVAAGMLPAPIPGGQPDYFGFTPNWAFTPLIRKFVDTLPGLGPTGANNLGNYIPIANPDTVTYPGSDYYEIELRQYTQQMHSDLPPTMLRGYVQTNYGTDSHGHNTVAPDPIHYLGPFIQARKDRPVRIKFTNKLPTGAGGDLFLPVDTTVMGAGAGPDGVTEYTQNRGTIHLHGGQTVWISDGTPHQWITPEGESTPYPKGVSVKPVPDMPDPGDGSMTFFYSNQQSARLLWFHDHTYGLTRLNVYAGEAGAYMLTDDTEQRLIRQGVLPADQIPLVIQDKTFVDAGTISTTDPTWNWGATPPTPNTGDLWFPHVYMPNQNPYEVSGGNTMGRWDYGLWFWPATTDIPHKTVDNPYYDPIGAPWEPPVMPGVPATSSVMEAYMDTPMVNGTPYPSVTLQAKSYRFRILNAANDRTFNLQLYQADPTVWTADGRSFTEVKMVPAAPTAGFPASWPVDGRPGGVPDPKMVGPDFIQVGNEAGFLPAPAVVKNQPVDWNLNMRAFTFGLVSSHALALAPGERADVIVDLSRYAGRTLILYNDAPAAYPANDPRNDYFTGAPDNRDTGGAASTEAGFGPNTRTVMQIKVVGKPAPAFDLAKLQAAFASTVTTPGVFAESQDPIIVAQPAYDSAYATSFPTVWPYAGYANINDTAMSLHTVAGTTATITFMPKGMHDEMGGSYDEYGRMAGKLGLAVPGGSAITQGFIPQTYIDRPSENLTDSVVAMSSVAGDGTQIWKITHNGVDTHPIHFHLFDIQLINRVGWDGAVQLPDANELGWKESVRINPLQDTIVAMRPVSPKLPFGVPESVRLLDPTQPLGGPMGFSNRNPLNNNPLVPPQLNEVVNFGWEYMWHCHILSHEEMEMMRPISFDVTTTAPAAPVLAANGVPASPVDLRWIDATPVSDLATWGDPRAEIGFRIERSTIDTAGAETTPFATIGTALANATTFRDATTAAGTIYLYRVIAYNASGETASAPVRVAPPGALSTYAVSPWASTRGSITPSGVQAVARGADSPAFTIAADPNCRIVDVMIDGVSVGATTSVTLTNVQNDHAVWAIFGPAMVPVTVIAGANGSVSPGGIPAPLVVAAASFDGMVRAAAPGATELVPYGEHVTFSIMPRLGYSIADVIVDGDSVGVVYSYTFEDVTSPRSISALFTPNVYTITPTVTGQGSISPGTPQVVAYGGGQTFAITPAPGGSITDVLVNGVSVGPVSSVPLTNVTSDNTIAAVFAALPAVTPTTPTAPTAPTKAATSITIRSSATSTNEGMTPILSGSVTPSGMIGVNIVVYVKKPGRAYWSYSSTRTVYRLGGGAVWQYKYHFKQGMREGRYYFRAFAPAPGLASSAGFAASASSVISIRLR
jgi:FtsP/CotA-like multicopper oxidase with cupredoxin domain